MKIARVFPAFQTEILYSEHYIARELKKDGHYTVFITSDKYLSIWKKYIKQFDGAGHYHFADYEVIRLPSFFPMEKAIFKNWIKLYKILFISDLEIIHLSGVATFTTLIILFLSLFRLGKHKPIFVNDHSNPISGKSEGLFAKLYHTVFLILLSLFKNRIKKIISFSESGASFLSKRYKIKINKFVIIPLGYDNFTFKYIPRLKNSSNKLILGFAGKINPNKRIDFLIKTIYESELSDFIKIIIVGYVYDDEHCKFLLSLKEKYNSDIEFLPFMKSSDLVIFYNYIDLAVFPGSISITTIEANGCGTPVLLYESIEGVSERVIDGRGMLFKNEEELLDRLQKYVELKKNKLIDNFHIEQITKNQYSWTNIKNQYLKIYSEFLFT